MLRNVVLALVLLAAVSSGQWLETTIELPHAPGALCYSLPADKLLCANPGGDIITVISGQTNGVIGTIPLELQPTTLFAHPTAAKVYCTDGEGRVAVIDALADTVAKTLMTDAAIDEFCFCPATNKLYGRTGQGLTVIDTETDTVVASIAVTQPLGVLRCNPVTSRLYLVQLIEDKVTVIDGRADTVRATIQTGFYPNDGRLDTVLNRLFVSCSHPAGESTLHYIDCAAETVISRIRVPLGPTGLTYNQTAQRLYVSNTYKNTVSAYQGTTGSFVAWRHFFVLRSSVLFYNDASNKVYAFASVGMTGPGIVALDGGTLQVVATVATDSFPDTRRHAWNPEMNRFYVGFPRHNRISVIRDSISSAVEETPGAGLPAELRPTIVRGVLSLGAGHNPILPGESGLCPKPAILLDAAGRKVMELAPGENDVRHLAPGVYFVRPASDVERSSSSVRRVVITR